MKSISPLLLSLTFALASYSAAAQDAVDHKAHHPAATSTDKPESKAADQTARMDIKMKTMREMHQKMMDAKTPNERKELMAEHMKTMQDSMSMMTGMMGAGTGDAKKMSPQAMQKQMDMMTMMMQMMMDTMEPANQAPPK